MGSRENINISASVLSKLSFFAMRPLQYHCCCQGLCWLEAQFEVGRGDCATCAVERVASFHDSLDACRLAFPSWWKSTIMQPLRVKKQRLVHLDYFLRRIGLQRRNVSFPHIQSSDVLQDESGSGRVERGTACNLQPDSSDECIHTGLLIFVMLAWATSATVDEQGLSSIVTVTSQG